MIRLAALGALFIFALGAAAPASARDGRDPFTLLVNVEGSNGYFVYSDSAIIDAVRVREGDVSLLLTRLADYTTTLEGFEYTIALDVPLRRSDGFHAAMAYDHAAQRIIGGAAQTRYFNERIAPRFREGPRDVDARWSQSMRLSELGLVSAPDPTVRFDIERRFVTHRGRRYALVSFAIPPMRYHMATGEPLIHWTNGFAIADDDFAVVYALGVRHRGVAGDDRRPLHFDRSMQAIDAAGAPVLDLDDFPAARALVRQGLAGGADSGMEPLLPPIVDLKALSDRSFFQVAGVLDYAALAFAEQSANDLATLVSDETFARAVDLVNMYNITGAAQDASIAQALARETAIHQQATRNALRLLEVAGQTSDPALVLAAGQRAADQTELAINSGRNVKMLSDAAEKFQSLGRAATGLGYGADAITIAAAMTAPDDYLSSGSGSFLDQLGRRLIMDTLVPVTASAIAGDIRGAGLSGLASVSKNISDVRLAYERYVDTQYDVFAAAQDERLLLHRRTRQILDLIEGLGDEIADTRRELQELEILLNPDPTDRRRIAPDIPTAEPGEPSAPNRPRPPEPTREELIRGLAAAIEAGDGYPLARPRDPAAPRPAEPELFTPEFAFLFDDISDVVAMLERERILDRQRELFELQQARAEREAAERVAFQDRQYKTVESMDLQDFVDKNAFKYKKIKGKVATDLTPYLDWLFEQDVRKVERLVYAAGYPNLASALNDWSNLVKNANDQGFRAWAFSAPVPSTFINAHVASQQKYQARAQVLLGDLLNDTRFIESIGGLSDVAIRGTRLNLALIDFGIVDGDVITIEVSQLGRNILSRNITLPGPPGEPVSAQLRAGIAAVVITAVNEGLIPPNTARVEIGEVVEGLAAQNYSLRTGERATLRVEAGR